MTAARGVEEDLFKTNQGGAWLGGTGGVARGWWLCCKRMVALGRGGGGEERILLNPGDRLTCRTVDIKLCRPGSNNALTCLRTQAGT